MPPAPPPEPLGLGRLVPLPLLRLLLPDGPQSIELLLPLPVLLLLKLPGMQFSLPMPLPLEPLLEPGIPELLLPPPPVFGFVGLLPSRILPPPVPTPPLD